jgi:Leucine-rich repeat (LRR) protein
MDVTHDWPLERLSTLRELRIQGEDSVIPDGTWKLPELRTLVMSSADGCTWAPYPLPDSLYDLRELTDLVWGAHLRSIPDGFSQLADLTSLELSAVSGVLPAHLGRLTNLQSLTLQKGSGELEVSILGSLLSLQQLELHSVDLSNLDFSQLTRLTTMTLTECSGELHTSIGQLCSLQSLELMEHEQLVLPDQFGCLSALTSLDIFDKGGELQLPPAIGRLSSLRKLLLYLEEVVLPHECGQLQQLQELRVSGATRLPQSLTNMSQLTSLCISFSYPTATPFALDKLPRLRARLPQSLTNMSQLTSLCISFSYPTATPFALDKLPRLRDLSVGMYDSHGGHCTGLPWRDFLSNSTSLTSLAVWGSYDIFFQTLPTLPNLRKLELSLDKDEALPEAVTGLSQVTSLVLSLDVPMPVSIFGLSSLRALRIDRSPGCKLPTSISKLQNLMYLSLPEEV